eukprot:3595118-Rhodomonas_salina.1
MQSKYHKAKQQTGTYLNIMQNKKSHCAGRQPETGSRQSHCTSSNKTCNFKLRNLKFIHSQGPISESLF